jgi:hypothetical protein
VTIRESQGGQVEKFEGMGRMSLRWWIGGVRGDK